MEDLTGKQLGPYTIAAPLSEGGMAAVYKAYQPSMDRHVALKVLSKRYASETNFLERFKLESRIIASLEHPHILPVYDFGEMDGYTFLAMRLVEHGTLADLTHNPLPPAHASALITQIADALDYAHTKGVIHRDLKPRNILIDDQGNCLLADFGLAKILSHTSGITVAGSFMGTPAYASPEQCMGKSLDGRSDIYSLGVILYEMLTGQLPFQSETLMGIVMKHLHEPPKSPRSIAPSIPEALENVALKALAKKPDKRYQTARELASDLGQAIQPGSAISINPPRPAEESGRSKNGSLLPRQLTPLIGREKDVAAILEFLSSRDVTLLTLIGPGGIGKTRVALQVAAELSHEFEDGVFFVPLAAITNPDLVITALAQTLGVDAQPRKGGNLLDLLKEFAQDKHMLLVLDNIEHLLAAVPAIEELIAASSSLKILVTSRVVLRVYGENIYSIPPLMLPETTPLPELAELARVPSVSLFTSRAQAVRPNFNLTSENAALVAAICIKLEGIPLALELAAARIKVFAPLALLKSLDNRLALGTQKVSGMGIRHQTLKDTIAWSYQLLEPPTQTLFAQLGVFRGGCTVTAVEAVTRLEPGAPILDQLMLLLDQSMLQSQDRSDGEPRFILLETLREYALEQLQAAGEMETFQRRHASYYLQWVEAIEPPPLVPDLLDWMKQLSDEHDNIRAALQWALDHTAYEMATRIAGAIWKFWQIWGYAKEGCLWLEKILEKSQGQLIPARTKALWGAGWLFVVIGDPRKGQAYFEEGERLSRAWNDQTYLAKALNGLGAIARNNGEFEKAQIAYEESLYLFRQVNNPEEEGWALLHFGVTALEQGDLPRAITLLSESLKAFQELSQLWASANALVFLGHAALQQGNNPLAQAQYETAQSIWNEMHDQTNTNHMNSCIGLAQFRQGNQAEALRRYQESLETSKTMKDYWVLVWCIELLADAAGKLDQPTVAAQLWGAADTLRRSTGAMWPTGFHSLYTDERFTSLKRQLGESQWNQLWQEGKAWNTDQATQAALQVQFIIPSHS